MSAREAKEKNCSCNSDCNVFLTELRLKLHNENFCYPRSMFIYDCKMPPAFSNNFLLNKSNAYCFTFKQFVGTEHLRTLTRSLTCFSQTALISIRQTSVTPTSVCLALGPQTKGQVSFSMWKGQPLLRGPDPGEPSSPARLISVSLCQRGQRRLSKNSEQQTDGSSGCRLTALNSGECN